MKYVSVMTLPPPNMLRIGFIDGLKQCMWCLWFLEEGLLAAYIYTSIEFSVLYYDSAIFKNVCDCVGLFLGSIQFLYDAFNFY